MERFTLNAQPRETGKKGFSRKTRAAGGTVGVVYRAGEPASPIRFDAAELATIFRKTANPNVLVDVVLGDQTRTCMVREVQRHPVSRAVEHVDFYEVSAGSRVRVDVPVKTVGRAAGTRLGGTLRVLSRKITVACDPLDIPDTIEVDVTPLEVGQFVKASQVKAPEGVSLVYSQDYNVVTVEGKRAERGDAPAAEGAAPAAAAAAPAAAKPAKK